MIGNGASLNLTPMDRLRDEFTIACNRFNLLDLDWDPTWWVMGDVSPLDEWDWNIMLQRQSMFLFRDHDRELIEPFSPIGNVIYMKRCEHIGGAYVPKQWHLPTPCDYGGSISLAIQTAAALRHNPIYLLGCDLYQYRSPASEDLNHFHPGYTRYKRRKSTGEEIVGPAEWERLNRRLILGHEISLQSAARIGITIYNATVGGALEVYERADIWDVLDGR